MQADGFLTDDIYIIKRWGLISTPLNEQKCELKKNASTDVLAQFQLSLTLCR